MSDHNLWRLNCAVRNVSNLCRFESIVSPRGDFRKVRSFQRYNHRIAGRSWSGARLLRALRGYIEQRKQYLAEPRIRANNDQAANITHENHGPDPKENLSLSGDEVIRLGLD